ncbi:MAG: hypothetical protein FD167_2770 [bacterium]|nr:MAG: hypothetical protein FD167_2770 [bacterium]
MEEIPNDLSSYSREERLQFCRIVANMIAADHKITEEEQSQLAILVWQAGLSMLEEDVAEAVKQELENPSQLSDLVKDIDKPDMKRWLYRVLVELAYVDLELAPEETDKLKEMSTAFGLNQEAAEKLIDWTKHSIELERQEAEIMSQL